MKYLIFLSIILFGSASQAQDKQKEILALLNAVRTNPQEFITKYLNSYITDNNMNKNPYALSLVSDLERATAMEPLTPSNALNKTAGAHALDMGKHDTIGHNSSDGTPFDVRLRKRAKAGGMIGENCDYGRENPLDVVMALLIDDGIPSLGHRKNILEYRYKYIGIGIEKHKTYGTNCVMDFAEKF